MIRVKKVYFQDLSVGVDMGEIYAFSSFCENGHASIITGRKLRSLHRLRNKKLADIQRLQSKCKKGHINGKSTNAPNSIFCPSPKNNYRMLCIK